MHRGLLLALVSLVAATAATAATARSATPAACGKLLPPAQGVYFGAAPPWANESVYYEGPAHEFDLAAGLTASWTMFGQWWSPTLPFPTRTVQSIWRSGKVPYLRLNPYPLQVTHPDLNGMDPGPFTLADIIAGKYDAQLRTWADTARTLDIPVLAEFGTEENNYFPWGPRNNGKDATTGYGDPAYFDGAERFRDAYRHVVTVTREEGATNITWFFHADTAFYYGPEPWNELRYAYPGDDYVDWLGLSLYAMPKFAPDAGYTSLAEKLQTYHAPDYVGSYAELTALSSRPLALVEVGFNTVPVAARVPWVSDAAATIESGMFPRLKGLVWWNIPSGTYDSSVTASPDFNQAFRAAFDDPFFAAGPQFTGDCSPLRPNVRVKESTLSWREIPNAAAYEVWRDGEKVATVKTTSYRAPRRGTYVVRGLSLVGAGKFSAPRRAPRP